MTSSGEVLQRSRQLERERVISTREPLNFLALWQGAGFLLIVLLIWVAYTLDLSALFFDGFTRGQGLGWVDACVLTAAVIVVAFITVGNTWLQQKRILRGLITVCSYCRKVKIDEVAWNQMEEFISARSLVDFTHGVCPTCYERIVAELDAEKARAAEKTI